MELDQNAVVVVLCTVPDEACAEKLAQALLNQRLAACVNIAAPSRSVYRWQGKMEISSEIALTIKTVQVRVSELKNVIKALHPYEVPEIMVIPVLDGLSAYLDWVRTETRDENHD